MQSISQMYRTLFSLSFGLFSATIFNASTPYQVSNKCSEQFVLFFMLFGTHLNIHLNIIQFAFVYFSASYQPNQLLISSLWRSFFFLILTFLAAQITIILNDFPLNCRIGA